MKKIAILGSTGSIGTQTLAVVAANRDKFQVMTLAANTNDQLLEQQIKEFEPELAVLVDLAAAKRLQKRFVGKTKILAGQEGLLRAATYEAVETVVTSMVGFAGLEPTIAAIEAGKDIALANKETLVVAGELVMKLAREKGVSILPVDSEHCAIFQCLQGEDKRKVHKILLTASGGPFRGKTRKELMAVSIKDCLNHPTWSMGKKISIDSASIVNKGLEVIEAKWLYGVEYDQIQVLVHPQSIVHSMVEYIDGTVMAQLGSTDMRLPIQYALTYPQRIESNFPKLDFGECKDLTFAKPDLDTFLGLKMAYEAGRVGGTMPCAFNAANEIAVEAFLNETISFLQIYDIIEKTMMAHHVTMNPTLQDLYENDSWARSYAADLFSK